MEIFFIDFNFCRKTNRIDMRPVGSTVPKAVQVKRITNLIWHLGVKRGKETKLHFIGYLSCVLGNNKNKYLDYMTLST